MAMSTLLLLKLEDQMLCPYTIQTASNCVALKATGGSYKPVERCSNQFKEEKTLSFVSSNSRCKLNSTISV